MNAVPEKTVTKVSVTNMTEADLAHAEQVIQNAFELMRDIIANPSALEHVPSPSTIEVIPLAEVLDEDEIVARTERFAVKVVSPP